MSRKARHRAETKRFYSLTIYRIMYLNRWRFFWRPAVKIWLVDSVSKISRRSN